MAAQDTQENFPKAPSQTDQPQAGPQQVPSSSETGQPAPPPPTQDQQTIGGAPPPPPGPADTDVPPPPHLAPQTPQAAGPPSIQPEAPSPETQPQQEVARPPDEAQPPPTPPSPPGGAPTPPGGDIPTQVISGEKESWFKRLPIQKILIGLVLLLILGGAAFIARQFLGSRGESQAPLTQPPKKEINLTYWGLWEDESIIQEVIKEYEAQNEGIRISYVKQAKEDYRERLLNSLAKGEGPDVFRYHNTWVPMLASALAPLPPEVMDGSAYQQTFYPVAGETLRSGANIVGIPLMFDGLGLYVNEDLFAAAGQNFPTTWDELRQAAAALTVRDDQGRIQQAGAALGRTDNVDHWQDILALMMLQNGADLANPSSKLAEDSLTFFTIFSTQDEVWDETLPPSTQAFAAGKLAAYFGPSWRVFEIKKANPSLRFKIVPVPQLPKASPNEKDVTWASFWAEGVWNKSKAQKEAWSFLEFLSSKQALQKMYQTAAATRLFGEPYPRPDMAQLLESDPLVGAYIKQAPNAQSWYLASRTFDGPTGINSTISAYYEDAVNAVVEEGKEPAEVLPTVAAGVKEVLARYNITR